MASVPPPAPALRAQGSLVLLHGDLQTWGIPQYLDADGVFSLASSCTQFSSVAQETARLWLAAHPDDQHAWVSTSGSWVASTQFNWLELMRELVQLTHRGGYNHMNVPTFSKVPPSVQVSDDGTEAWGQHQGWKTVACGREMRAGRHFVVFHVYGWKVMFGVIRPNWNVEAADAEQADGHCFYYGGTGQCFAGPGGGLGWPGMAKHTNCRDYKPDRIGMLLDFDQGSMTVYKNGELLGVMMTGLSGPYCWAARVIFPNQKVRIEAAPVP